MPNPSTILSPRSRSARVRQPTDPFPRHLQPMLAVLSAHLPADGKDWAFEYKWDGVRAIAYKEKPSGDRASWRIESRNLLDITHRYPELLPLRDALGKRQVGLDGEIVALDERDRPSFPLLQRRMHVNDAAQIAALSRSVPIVYVLFDVLYLDGRSLHSEPYAERRAILESLNLIGPHWQITPSYVNRGQRMLDAARKHGMEGIVAKTLTSIYEPGRRSPSWLKIKIIQRQEFVIGGWTRESTGLRDRIGTMLLGYYDKDRKLHYAGHVGTGLVAADHAPLVRQFEKLARATNPFVEKLPAARRGGVKIQFLEPKLVGEVEYRRWPQGAMVQQASFKGLREDKAAKNVVRETPQ
jgi:bifunctional non-homologous end joining protein LigD